MGLSNKLDDLYLLNRQGSVHMSLKNCLFSALTLSRIATYEPEIGEKKGYFITSCSQAIKKQT